MRPRNWSSESSQSPADGVADEVGPLVDVDSSHDPGPMGLSGLDLDAEERRNLLRLLTLGDQLKNLSLPPRQAIGRKVGLGQRGRSDGQRDAGAYVHPSPGHFADRADEGRHPVGLQDESPTSRPEGFGKVLGPG